MKENCDILPKCLSQFGTIRKIQNKNWIVDDPKFEVNGSKKHILETTTGHSCCPCAQDLSAALQQQMNSVRSDKIVTVHGGNGKRSHPLNSNIERFAGSAVEEE